MRNLIKLIAEQSKKRNPEIMDEEDVPNSFFLSVPSDPYGTSRGTLYGSSEQ